MELSMDMVKAALRQVIEEEMGSTECRIATRWQGGKLVIHPFDSSQAAREIPLSVFFKKLTSVREKLRVLEQKINSNDALSDEDRLELQQAITRCYGSLTTFNFLFQDERDKFVGMKGAD